MIKVVGSDVSLNHGAFVELSDGELSNFWYYTDFAGSANASKKRGHRLPTMKTSDRQIKGVFRLAWIERFFREIVVGDSPADYYGIEDYALDAKHGSHYQGEVGGVCRITLWNQGIKFRLHDPISLKMFATHKGNCEKELVEEVVCEKWGADFSSLNQPRAKPTKARPNPKQNRQTSQDLSDAYALAKLVWTEVQLRSGNLLLSDLHPQEVRVFNRVTKSYPVSLLDRDWIFKGE